MITPPTDEFKIDDCDNQGKKFGVIVADPPWSFSDKLKYYI